ncbi:MAG: ribonuclease III [Clostridia bacterium]|nr:ribonuclease III [Clostridia bacterium]
MNEFEIKTVSAAALAYLGDSVIEICVREHLVKNGLSSSARLNEEALRYVKATAQAEAMKNILPILTEEENSVFRRGRNIGHTSTPKSAKTREYRTATGMEALFGWLHLMGRAERIKELFSVAYGFDN